MDPIASAGKKPADEEILHSLGWTFHAPTQKWNYHKASIPCLSQSTILVEDVLKTMWTVLGKSMDNIAEAMAAMGVTVPGFPVKPKTAMMPSRYDGAPDEFHKLLDTAVDAARRQGTQGTQGTRIEITLDPPRPQMLDPLKTMERMLSNVCPNCGGRHGC